MKFIREIISGKHGAADRANQNTGGNRPGPDRVDPQVRDAAEMRPESSRVPAAALAGDDGDELYRLVEGASWLRPDGKSDLSRNIAAAIQEREEDPADEAYAPAALRSEGAEFDGDADGAEDGFDLEGEDDFCLTDEDEPDDLDEDNLGLFDEDETDPGAEDDDAPVVSKYPTPVTRPAEIAARPAPRQSDIPDPAADRRHVPQPSTEKAPQPRAAAGPDARLNMDRPVTQLRDIRQDPFDRLERLSGTEPAPDTRSPFQRMPDRHPAESVPTARPRTKLAENLMMPTPMQKPAPLPTAALTPEAVEVPAPAVGRAARRAERVKTRLLGFGDPGGERNPFEAASVATVAAAAKFPVGWMVVTGGPGRGHSFTLLHGVSQIGRGEDQAIRLDFGDTSISRSNHAAIAYDPENRKFFLGHGGKANLVRLNGKPVLSTEELPPGGVIHIGETTLQFVALCGAGFDWDKNHDDDVDTAVFG